MTSENFALDDDLIRESNRYAPLPAGSDAQMVRYLTLHRDRTVALLGEIDETLDVYRRALDAYQPKSNQKVGLIWMRESDRLNGATKPIMVRWLIRNYSGGMRWFYTELPQRDLPRRAKSRGGWALGAGETKEALRRIQTLMEQRKNLVAHWANLSRALSALEASVSDLREERRKVLEALPAAPFYAQSQKYNRGG